MSLARSPFMRVAVRGYLGWRFDVDAIRRIVQQTAEQMEGEAKSLLEGASGSGRAYPLPGGSTYTASGAGDLPASRTGELAKSILARRSKNGLAAWIGPSRKAGMKDPFYPAFLVYGTKTMAKRRNAISLVSRRYRGRFNRALAKAMETSIRPQA